MLGWSINLFRIRGIQLAVHASFLLLLAYVGEQGWREGHLVGLLWNVVTLLAFFTCVVLHELGHSFTAMHFGIGVRRILLMPIGGMAEFNDIPRKPSQEILITLAGPAVNFIIAAGLWFMVRTFNENSLSNYQVALYQLFFGNIVMGCFNMIPAFPMDGGRILRALLATRLPYLRATAFAFGLGKIISVAIIVGALLAPLLGWSKEPIWMLAVLFGFIFFAGDAEYRAAKYREQDDAEWRELVARYHRQSAQKLDETSQLPL